MGGSTWHGMGPAADSICGDKGGGLAEQEPRLCNSLADEVCRKMREGAQQTPIECESPKGVGITEAEDLGTDADMVPAAVEIECALVEHMPPDMAVWMGGIVPELEIPRFLFIKCADMLLEI